MKKIKHFLLSFLFYGSVVCGIAYTIYHVYKKNERMDNNLGKQVVIGNDTLITLTHDGTKYTLSNGRIISDKIIEQFKIKENENTNN